MENYSKTFEDYETMMRRTVWVSFVPRDRGYMMHTSDGISERVDAARKEQVVRDITSDNYVPA